MQLSPNGRANQVTKDQKQNSNSNFDLLTN
jgi:hypothetical protein